MAVRHDNLNSKTRLMLRDVRPSVKCHQGFSITCKTVVIAFAPSWGSRPRALLARLPSLFHRSPPNTDEPTVLQQRPLGSGTSSRRSPPVVDVPALDDKKALYVARRPERASDKAKRVDSSKWWARVVLFLCCRFESICTPVGKDCLAWRSSLSLPDVIIDETKFAWTHYVTVALFTAVL
ncbi:uncharacterized protein F5147DRAFT_656361 [Suillus discolor]|uniref:Uncharacterized protein n=1 Tax=Suillus discolor TaxID=1912936 RepID=A0A9P7JQ44_9AGAM|nr:uncharacterized protein F5147DRAFT_656361 [Suillus discolor]KAG2097562.1 hypothetical protein F5147DRAFT_656361 [Suillus discolor]